MCLLKRLQRPSSERTIALVSLYSIIIAVAVSLRRPYASSICSIFPLCMDSNALEKVSTQRNFCQIRNARENENPDFAESSADKKELPFSCGLGSNPCCDLLHDFFFVNPFSCVPSSNQCCALLHDFFLRFVHILVATCYIVRSREY